MAEVKMTWKRRNEYLDMYQYDSENDTITGYTADKINMTSDGIGSQINLFKNIDEIRRAYSDKKEVIQLSIKVGEILRVNYPTAIAHRGKSIKFCSIIIKNYICGVKLINKKLIWREN